MIIKKFEKFLNEIRNTIKMKLDNLSREDVKNLTKNDVELYYLADKGHPFVLENDLLGEIDNFDARRAFKLNDLPQDVIIYGDDSLLDNYINNFLFLLKARRYPYKNLEDPSVTINKLIDYIKYHDNIINKKTKNPFYHLIYDFDINIFTLNNFRKLLSNITEEDLYAKPSLCENGLEVLCYRFIFWEEFNKRKDYIKELINCPLISKKFENILHNKEEFSTPLHILAGYGIKEVKEHIDFDKVKNDLGQTPKDIFGKYRPEDGYQSNIYDLIITQS